MATAGSVIVRRLLSDLGSTNVGLPLTRWSARRTLTVFRSKSMSSHTSLRTLNPTTVRCAGLRQRVS